MENWKLFYFLIPKFSCTVQIYNDYVIKFSAEPTRDIWCRRLGIFEIIREPTTRDSVRQKQMWSRDMEYILINIPQPTKNLQPIIDIVGSDRNGYID